jgi:hypothetical protein
MMANHRDQRQRGSHSVYSDRRYSSNASDKSKGSKYKEKAYQYYTSFGGKQGYQADLQVEHVEPHTPQQHKDPNNLKKLTNFYLKNAKIDEDTLKVKSLTYLDKKGILKDKINKRYYKDNDLAKHLKVDRKQCLCHQMRIPDNQLRVRYPKNIGSLYQEDYEKKRK